MFAPPPQPDPELLRVAPASYVYADSLLREAVGVADLRNAAMGHPVACGGADVYVYDAASSASTESARGDQPGCRVYFRRSFRDYVWSTYTNPRVSRDERRGALAELCAVATHERLHNAGYGHSADPTNIMAPVIAVYPGGCVSWAREKLPDARP